MLRIFCTLPVTVAQAERSFSTLARVKNVVRSTMCQERLTSLGMLAVQGRLVMKAAKAAAYPVFLADFLFYFYLKIFEICIKFHWLSLVLSAMTNPPPPKKKIFFFLFFWRFFCQYFLFLMATLKKAAISYAFLEAGET